MHKPGASGQEFGPGQLLGISASSWWDVSGVEGDSQEFLSKAASFVWTLLVQECLCWGVEMARSKRMSEAGRNPAGNEAQENMGYRVPHNPDSHSPIPFQTP